MEREEIDKCLDRGERLALRTPTGSPEWLGWVTVTKRSLPLINPFCPSPPPPNLAEILKEHGYALKRPYHIHREEMLASVHESGEYPNNEDMRGIRNWYVASLDEVALVLESLGHDLRDLRPAVEVEAP